MKVKMKNKKLIKITMSIILSCMTTYVFALGYGQSASSHGSQSAAINELLANNNAQMRNLVKGEDKKAKVQGNSYAQVPKDKDLSLGDTSDGKAAFSGMSRSLMPLTPDQIKSLRAVFDKSKRAAAAYPGTPPRPTSASILVDLSPGSAPPVIRLQSGFISAVQFLDSTGQPWPVEAYDLGDTSNFNIQWNQASNPGTLLVQAMSSFRTGNLAVMLKGKPTPIMITLLPGQNAVDYRDELRVPGLGPNASANLSALPDTSSPQLLNILNGVAPSGAKQLQVSDGRSQAWLYNNKLYLRTRVTLLSPSWLSSMSSPDGTHAYKLTKSPVILVSNRGSVQQLLVKGL